MRQSNDAFCLVLSPPSPPNHSSVVMAFVRHGITIVVKHFLPSLHGFKVWMFSLIHCEYENCVAEALLDDVETARSKHCQGRHHLQRMDDGDACSAALDLLNKEQNRIRSVPSSLSGPSGSTVLLSYNNRTIVL